MKDDVPERVAHSSPALTSNVLNLLTPLAVALMDSERKFSRLILDVPDMDKTTLSEFIEEMPPISATPLHVIWQEPDVRVRLSILVEPLIVIVALSHVPESPSSLVIPDMLTARLSPENAPPDTLI